MLTKYKIVSDSMMPLIPIGSEIQIEKLESVKNLKKFDILLFKYQSQLFCHYYWHQNNQFDKGLITTRSLRTGDKDHPVYESDIIGRVKNFKMTSRQKILIYIRDLFNHD